ncbi:hypothetical protein [Rhodopirellula sp. MGV]|uniref:hypothetical protein n=1 Tax=Rhodopirellula sp. MGV TaxID=2023130 RepID=UPI000B969BEC|nr:hypothetical protein [Rhodopirellula sp. MGV]OYP34427.1 hypothetical protein CGZ80_15380 [Rhodopirellula sp. MGV]PNY37397.1 hypothetical protein C2E31_07640 [Rhodopirellula baltica]
MANKLRNRRRNGISLLEMVVAGTMITTIMMGMALVFRTSGQTWEVVDRDHAVERQLGSLVRHFVRESREAAAVVSISSRRDQISLLMNDGTIRTWRRNGDGEVQFQLNHDVAFQTLADDIEDLEFTGYDAAGVQLESEPNDMQLIGVVAKARQDRSSDPLLEQECKVWIRSW